MAAFSAVCYAIPSKKIMDFAIQLALTKSHKHIQSSICHAAGEVLRRTAKLAGDFALTMPSFMGSVILGYASEALHHQGEVIIKQAAIKSAPLIVRVGDYAMKFTAALNMISKPLAAGAAIYTCYVIARHFIEPPPYEAPPGCYPNGGPMVEISQEEAPKKSMVFACPAHLARLVQERTLLCERDPVMMQKVKAIAARWCDSVGLQGNQRYAAMCGAVAAALSVPINEQLVLQFSQSHAVQLQHNRIANYLQGIKHKNDPWWSKYFLIRH